MLGPAADLLPRLRIAVLSPGPRTNLWVYATVGASEAKSGPTDGLEFFMTVPAEDLRHVELLTMTAYYHYTDGLGLGHTFPIGEPWLSGSACDHMLVRFAYPFGPELEVCCLEESTPSPVLALADHEGRTGVQGRTRARGFGGEVRRPSDRVLATAAAIRHLKSRGKGRKQVIKDIGCDSYLENDGTVKHAQQNANHESRKTTKLCDRTGDPITLDEVERTVIERVYMLTESTMIYRSAGDVAWAISIGQAISMFGVLGYYLVMTLRKRRIGVGELMIYIAGAGTIIAIPTCFRLEVHIDGDAGFMYFDANWLSVGLCYLLLATIMLVTARKSEQ